MRHIRRGIAGFGVVAGLIVGCGLFSLPAHAVTRTVSLTASPAVLDIGGRPGDAIKFSFRITNSADVVLPIHMNARNAQVRTGQSLDALQAMSAKAWVEFDQPDFVLQSKEAKTVTGVLQIPVKAGPGGHYADLVVSPLGLEGSGGMVTAQPELVVQLLAGVTGAVTENMKLTLAGPATIVTSPSAQKQLAVDIKNLGNIHTLVQPLMYIWRGKSSLGTVESPPGIILPEESKQVAFTLPPALPAGIYHMQVKFNYGSPDKEAMSPIVQVIVLPFDPLFLLALPVLGFAAYLFHTRRRLISAVKMITKGE